jgi:hypothetical protein
MREGFREAFERHGELVLHTEQLAAFFPISGDPSPLHEIRSPVKHVREGTPLLGLSVWVLTLTIARAGDGETDLDVELSVTSAVWEGLAPRPGDAVQGLIWVQAVFE